MIEDYEASAMRHWLDAELLKGNGRHANANQLVGFAAECAIKAALRQIPKFSTGESITPKYRKHIDELWPLIPVQGLQKRFPVLTSMVEKQSKQSNPFHDWSTDHRYAKEGTVIAEAITRHRDWAKRVLGCVGLNGVRAGS